MSSFVAFAAAQKHLRGCFVSITDCSFLFVSDNKSFWLRKDFPWRKIFDRGKKKRKEELSGKQQKRVFICARAAHVTDNFENLANTRLVDTPKQVEPLQWKNETLDTLKLCCYPKQILKVLSSSWQVQQLPVARQLFSLVRLSSHEVLEVELAANEHVQHELRLQLERDLSAGTRHRRQSRPRSGSGRFVVVRNFRRKNLLSSSGKIFINLL